MTDKQHGKATESRPFRTILVIPCYNEAKRLDADTLESFLQMRPDTCFLFVDDGSQDNTMSVLRGIQERNQSHRNENRAQVVIHDARRNQGKAEAVRQGVLQAIGMSPKYLGYWDADLSTPIDELPRFETILETRPELLLVMGARVRLMGRNIHRETHRHYLGRIFATLASARLHLPVYDTQCGAKLFRVQKEELQALFGTPFRSPWVFDVELLARICAWARLKQILPASIIAELPLESWRDVGGSKLKLKDMAKSLYYMATQSTRTL